MERIILEIDGCLKCPYVDELMGKEFTPVCTKSKDRKLDYASDKILSIPIPEWCPQKLDSKTPLTKDNIKDYGFVDESLTSVYPDWIAYSLENTHFFIRLRIKDYKQPELKSGSWYYGSDFIKIDTVEELKMLYKLVTKKEL